MFFGRTKILQRAIRTEAGQFCLVLILWPIVLTLVPVNHFLVQLVALRATVWLLPLIFIVGQIKREDLVKISIAFAILNIVALGFSAYMYVNGVESLYPKNEVTRQFTILLMWREDTTEYPPPFLARTRMGNDDSHHSIPYW